MPQTEKGQSLITNSSPRPHRRRRRDPRGFTLIELLVTLGIILVLVGILIPTVKKMREKAQEASVRAQITSLESAINRYQQDFNAFPGPLPRPALALDEPVRDAAGADDRRADVARRDRAQYGIGQRVQRDVGVAMPRQPAIMRYPHAAQPQFLTRLQPVDVVAGRAA